MEHSEQIPIKWQRPFFTIWTGQALSLLGSLATAMTPLSLIVAGPIADAFGLRVWYVIGRRGLRVDGCGRLLYTSGYSYGRSARRE